MVAVRLGSLYLSIRFVVLPLHVFRNTHPLAQIAPTWEGEQAGVLPRQFEYDRPFRALLSAASFLDSHVAVACIEVEAYSPR